MPTESQPFTDTINGRSFPRRDHPGCPLCGAMRPSRAIPTRFGMTAMVAECEPCRLAFQSPLPAPEASAAYMNWRWGASDGYVADKDAKLREARKQLAIVERATTTRGRLLDFGAGNGAFVRAALDSGWDATGIEQSTTAIDRAREFYNIGLLADLADIPPASCDVITLWDVIEHLRDPIGLLTAIRTRLAPGGLLFVETGNWESYIRMSRGDRWSLYLFDHHIYFSPASLEEVLVRAGFTGFTLLDVNRAPFLSAAGLKSTLRFPRAPFAWLAARMKWPDHAEIDVMVATASRPIEETKPGTIAEPKTVAARAASDA